MATAEIRDPPASAEVEQEFERLYRRYVGDVLGYSSSVLGDTGQAEDIAQSTFLKAYRALRDGVSPEHPREWLITIARNECGMHFRAASRRPREIMLDEELAVPENNDATATEIRSALDQLRDNQRQALVMREFEGRSYEEIATALQLSGSAVETLLFRARRALREQLEAAEDGCAQAQRLIAASGRLTGEERAHLRAHSRSCSDCATLERQQRGVRSMLARVASLFPVPSWLPSLFSGAAVKTAAVVTVAAIGTGGAVTVVASPHQHARAKPVPHLRTVTNPWRTPATGPVQPRAAAPSASTRNTSRHSKTGTRRLAPRSAKARQGVVAPSAAAPAQPSPTASGDPVQPPAGPTRVTPPVAANPHAAPAAHHLPRVPTVTGRSRSTVTALRLPITHPVHVPPAHAAPAAHHLPQPRTVTTRSRPTVTAPRSPITHPVAVPPGHGAPPVAPTAPVSATVSTPPVPVSIPPVHAHVPVPAQPPPLHKP